MARSIWKGPFVTKYLLKKVSKARDSGSRDVIKIWCRNCDIMPQFIGLTFGVYNGRKHIPVTVSEEMVGFKFGDFSPTRYSPGHGSDKKVRRR
ncbi:30S ribosomal protein S19 [Candidatus Liberibacter solanacearum]|uniref:Small ribosomal subunit protein uS19 n=1 Tax=Candidatus Liberibacter solanacearum TaxID=556287 RepID=A0A094Z129_9HYPH|nr:30S ribosomal protein S19 [Candidatus Liberibacter solanacearum]KGB27317.1 30S ribosomal protein S19 [Candidatus Liberibacter solanacearum]KJZ80744.1 30S ribosomal protein S19 [Candidatus Liberibacter solanacearum]KJZ81841.1 SSU ribosomal protein S19p (S15e) [Candidatus Liberibacter solanacearum]KQC48894.1 30S ribosomal protein S19 [Candidatus Liberibacter solanacearum]RPD36838.1 30S ribosomal protein S19 [Candidatus Liberibacter solanacearum]